MGEESTTTTVTTTATTTTRGKVAAELANSDRLEILTRYSAGGMHDIANFVTVILGHCELLKQVTVPRTKAHMTAFPIAQAARNIQEIAMDVQAFNPNRRPMVAALDLIVFFQNEEVLLRDFLRGRVAVSYDFAPDLPLVFADPHYLRRVIGNLALNARAALEGIEGAMLKLSARCEAGGVTIRVADNGCGMSEATQLRLRMEERFTTKEGHTGLGLGVVRGVLREFGGKVEFESKEGSGTTFMLWLRTAGTPAA